MLEASASAKITAQAIQRTCRLRPLESVGVPKSYRTVAFYLSAGHLTVSRRSCFKGHNQGSRPLHVSIHTPSQSIGFGDRPPRKDKQSELRHQQQISNPSTSELKFWSKQVSRQQRQQDSGDRSISRFARPNVHSKGEPQRRERYQSSHQSGPRPSADRDSKVSSNHRQSNRLSLPSRPSQIDTRSIGADFLATGGGFSALQEDLIYNSNSRFNLKNSKQLKRTGGKDNSVSLFTGIPSKRVQEQKNLKHQQNKHRTKNPAVKPMMNKLSSSCYVQVLTSPTVDLSGTSLLLHFDSYRFLINCVEGTQRKLLEDGVKIGKTPTVLLTQSSWSQSSGGLPGFILNSIDGGCSSVDIHGPPDTCHTVASCRSFIARDAPGVKVNDVFDPLSGLVKIVQSKHSKKHSSRREHDTQQTETRELERNMREVERIQRDIRFSGIPVEVCSYPFVKVEAIHMYPYTHETELILDERSKQLNKAIVSLPAEQSLSYIVENGKDAQEKRRKALHQIRNNHPSHDEVAAGDSATYGTSSEVPERHESIYQVKIQPSAKDILQSFIESGGNTKLVTKTVDSKSIPTTTTSSTAEAHINYSRFANDALDLPGYKIKSDVELPERFNEQMKNNYQSNNHSRLVLTPWDAVKKMFKGSRVEDGSQTRKPIEPGFGEQANFRLLKKTDIMESTQIEPFTTKAVLSYKFSVPDKPAPFLVEEAKKLGVPKGILYRKLKDGESVVLPTGETITPDQVTGLKTAGSEILILDCPNYAYIPGIIENEFLITLIEKLLKSKEEVELERLSMGHSTEKIQLVLVHSLGANVVLDERYKRLIEYLDTIKDSNGRYVLTQIVCSPELNPLANNELFAKKEYIEPFFLASQFRKAFNTIDGKVYPMFNRFDDILDLTESDSDKLKTMKSKITTGNRMTVYRVAPNPKFVSGKSWALDKLNTSKSLATDNKDNSQKNSKKGKSSEDFSGKFVDTCVSTSRTGGKELLRHITSSELSPNLVQYCKETLSRTGMKIKNSLETNQINGSKENYIASNVWVSPLGTGSSLPSRQKGMSSILIEIGDEVSVPNSSESKKISKYALFDTSEGTLGALKRKHGLSKVRDQIMKNLNLIFISHLHADHHLGLWSVVNEWIEVQLHHLKSNGDKKRVGGQVKVDEISQTLIVIAPPSVKTIIIEAAQRENVDIYEYLTYKKIIFIESSSICGSIDNYKNQAIVSSTYNVNANKILNFKNANENQSQSNGLGFSNISNFLSNISTFPVAHCVQSFGIILGKESQVIYTGDCRPKINLNKYVSQKSRPLLIIHEATLDDTREEDAVKKMHSTVSGAITIARSIQAKNCLLTHFSQRYKWFPLLTKTNYEKISSMIMSGPLDKQPLLSDVDIPKEVSMPINSSSKNGGKGSNVNPPATVNTMKTPFERGQFNINGFISTFLDNEILVHPLMNGPSGKRDSNGGSVMSNYMSWDPSHTGSSRQAAMSNNVPQKVVNSDKDLSLAVRGITEADIYDGDINIGALSHTLADVNNFLDSKIRRAVISMNLPSSFSSVKTADYGAEASLEQRLDIQGSDHHLVTDSTNDNPQAKTSIGTQRDSMSKSTTITTTTSDQETEISVYKRKAKEQYMTLAFTNDHLVSSIADLWRVQVVAGIFAASFAQEVKPTGSNANSNAGTPIIKQ